jgi:amino acid adenylation domain-containing protein
MQGSVSIFPASFAQSRLWFIHRMSPTSAAYNMLATLTLPKGCTADEVQDALCDIVAHHETLRTSFALEDGQVVQRIHTDAEIALDVHRCVDAQQSGKVVSECLAVPFDLAATPLARAIFMQIEGRPPTLSLIVNHIIADGQTLQILAEHLVASLTARAMGNVPILPQTPIEYADYAVWQHRMLQGPRRQRLMTYWTERLADLPQLALTHDRERQRGRAEGGVVRFSIDAETTAGLRRLAGQARTTLFGVLLTGYAALLARISGQSDLPIGLPVSGRSRVEFERVAGLFINSVVFRARISTGASFLDAARRIGADLLADLEHQEMPFEVLVETLRPQRRVDANPLFQTMFQMQVNHGGVAADRTEEPQLDRDKLSAQLDLSFILFDNGTGLIEGGVVFSAALFDVATIEELASAYTTLLAAASCGNDCKIGTLPLLAGQRRSARLALSHGPIHDWQGPELLHEWFTEQARKAPDRIALETGTERLSLAQIDRRSDAVASALRSAGVVPGTIVALLLPRSASLIAAMIGTLKAGAAYLAVDVGLPTARRDLMLRDCGAKAIAVSSEDATLPRGACVVRMPGTDANCAFDALAQPNSDPAYVVYTSGSTGQPNGVAISHSAAVNHMHWMIECFGFGPGDRVLQRTPISFDASIWEIWVPLLSGGCLVLPDQGRPFDPQRLLSDITRHSITTLQVVPSLLGALLDHPSAGHLAGLKRCFCGGEALNGSLVQRFLDVATAELVNLYGPSEATIDATWHRCDLASELASVPIGRPIANVSAYVLDQSLEPLPAGVIGELFIGGQAVGIGYVGDGQGRAQRFLSDPHSPGGRLYRTGDRAVMRADGRLFYHGRLDDQIKVRGVRIEPGEIESRLLSHPEVSEAAVVVQSHGVGDDRLVAYVHLRPGGPALSGADLIVWLRDRLPPLLMPSLIEIAASLPRTLHGKIDRAALSRLRVRPPSARRMVTANATESEISREFARILGVSAIDADDDFFHLGGHSLLVVPLCAALTEAIGIEVDVVDVFEHPTPQRLAATLAERAAAAALRKPATASRPQPKEALL